MTNLPQWPFYKCQWYIRYVQFYAKGRSQPEIGGSDMANPNQKRKWVFCFISILSLINQSCKPPLLLLLLRSIEYNTTNIMASRRLMKVRLHVRALIQTGKCLLSPEQRKRRNARNVDCHHDATAALSRERRFCWRYPTLSNYSPCKNRRKPTMIRLAASVAKHLSFKLRSGLAPPLFVSYVCSAPPLHTAWEPNASRKELSTFIWNVLG